MEMETEMEEERSAQLVRRGERLSFLLRHDKDYDLYKGGWRKIADLVENHGYTFDELCEIVDTDDKGRYELSDDRSRIRALYGHSVKVDLELEAAVPPAVLYHGTARHFVDSIRKGGIQRKSRCYVHLSPTVETAVQVGKRHGEPVVLEIAARQMHEDGISVYPIRNGMWLVEYVDAKYLMNV